MSKSYAPKDAPKKRRGTRRKATKVMADRNSLPTIAVWELGDAHRGIAAQFEKFRDTQVHQLCHAFASELNLFSGHHS